MTAANAIFWLLTPRMLVATLKVLRGLPDLCLLSLSRVFRHLCACVPVPLMLSCVRLCDSMDSSPPGSSVHGIFQATIPEIRLPFPPPGIFLTQELNP